MTQPPPDETTRRDPKNTEQGLRCETCGAYFSTEAVLGDHQKMHGASGAEREELQERQGERKP